ncbi:hypothetical protein C7C45_11030 [Micromonospora arborensis]|uniref:Nucleotidyltransferase domain-containing protein n=1 Tax=Micromonospora arborensis TaxID=2116518 RepID=A0A318NRC4_9ACTN|nr:hypothetical protein [Micromonospora arborensis]PYC71563.1 hypothetical protein C7C45_11030 [Micromonospora arborensis]
MFSVGERDSIRERLLGLAEGDPAVVGAAITGSHAVSGGDRWSDIDVAFGIEGPLDSAMRRWTELLYRDFAAVHHWDLPSGSSVYRVFLLPEMLEVDIGFTPAAEFGPHGPNWRTVFGHPAHAKEDPSPCRRTLVGLGWHHALHAWTCIRRHRWWQAEQWISALRGQVLALACLRLGHPTSHAKGAHLLPSEVTAPLNTTLVRALDEAELTRALTAATAALIAELTLADAALAARLAFALSDLCVDGRPPGSNTPLC